MTCDPDGPAFFAEKALNEVPECEEVDGVFMYTVRVYRDVYDDFDIYSSFFDKEES